MLAVTFDDLDDDEDDVVDVDDVDDDRAVWRLYGLSLLL